MRLLLVLGDQLFPIPYFESYKDSIVFMKEDVGLCTHFRYHKHKIIFFLSSMRRFASELKQHSFNVSYHRLDDRKFQNVLIHDCKKHKIKEIVTYEIQDKFFEKEIHDLCIDHDLKLTILPSPMFLSSRENFQHYLKSHKKPFMKTFYESERKRLKKMVDNDHPWGGKWSFDEENRKKAYLRAWKEGKTGYPLVDACMRCVKKTGYLNFRMRAMVVSFLTHHLWQPW